MGERFSLLDQGNPQKAWPAARLSADAGSQGISRVGREPDTVSALNESPSAGPELIAAGVVKVHGTELANKRARDLDPAVCGETIHGHYAEALSRRAPLAHRLLFDFESLRSSYLRIILACRTAGGRSTA